MNINRIVKHLLKSDFSFRKRFSHSVMKSIENAIAESEKHHSAEIRFAVENTLEFYPLVKDIPARERAIEVFSNLRIWDTDQNNGVLIYLLLADNDVEIIADRGIDRKVGSDEWERICKYMENHFKSGQFETGVIKGIDLISKHLEKYYPFDGANKNELPDRPVVL